MIQRFLLLAALFASAVLGQPAPTRQFIYKLEPVRKDLTLQNITEAERPILAQHAAYLKKLLDDGKLILAGQAFDPAGLWGIVIVNAPDAAAAEAIMNGDAAVQAKIFHGTVIPFRVVFQRPPEAASKP